MFRLEGKTSHHLNTICICRGRDSFTCWFLPEKSSVTHIVANFKRILGSGLMEEAQRLMLSPDKGVLMWPGGDDG